MKGPFRKTSPSNASPCDLLPDCRGLPSRQPSSVIFRVSLDSLLLLRIRGRHASRDGVASLNTRRSQTVVALSATRAFTSRWLVPRTTSFAAAHPGMDLQLHAPVDFFRGAKVDVVIHYNRGSFPGLKAEELFRDEFAPVANPHLGLREPSGLHQPTLIHFEWYRTDRQTPIWSRWLAQGTA